MNNMNDAYNRIYGFHERIPSIEERNNKPDPLSFSQKDKFKGPLKNQKINTREQTSAPGNSSSKSGSKPFILPPPKIEAQQLIRRPRDSKKASKNKVPENKKMIEEKKNQKNEVNTNSSDKSWIDNKGKASYMLTPFSPRLSWSPTLPEESSAGRTQFYLKDISASEGAEEVFSNLELNDRQFVHDENPKENTPSIEESHPYSADYMADKRNGNSKELDNSSLLEQEFLLMLQGKESERSESSDTPVERLSFFENKLTSDAESESQDYLAAPTEEELPLVEKFFSMLYESSSEEVLRLSLNNHPPSQQDEVFSVMSDLYSEEEESSAEKHDSLDNYLMDEEESSAAKDINSDDNHGNTLDANEETSSFDSHQPDEKDQHLSQEDVYLETDESGLPEDNDSAPYKGEFSFLLEKAYSILEDLHPENNDFQGFQGYDDIEQSLKMQETFSNLLQKAHESKKKNKNMITESDENLKKVSDLLENFSRILNTDNEESSSALEDLGIADNELPSCELESDCQDSSCYSALGEKNAEFLGMNEEESSSREKFFSDLEDSSSHPESKYRDYVESSSECTESTSETTALEDAFDQKFCPDEPSEENPCHSTHTKKCLPKVLMPTVKVPVLVDKLNIEIDIFDTFPIHLPIKNITKLEWSIQTLETNVILPSDVIFLKGTLLADLEYVDNAAGGSLHTIKIPVKWDKTADADWLYPPEMPITSFQKEYSFKTDDGQGISSHYEAAQYFSEKIEAQLQSIHFVWHNDIIENEKSEVDIQGRAILEIDLLQKQYVDLNLA
ncbi:hypothetical protein AF332_17100 [Sporosarcina globispora]|uniref:DUF3794 domain-containing protein n=1 Tax=Sporosarcina globispora TaxID=1459 RepID=A0A0M0GFZ0_SPOGL|nr:hypothetical protein [Sporosarcina globispora]KON88351.1 hypothetical protein AF332_17100 [Sporosarcina globispora]